MTNQTAQIMCVECGKKVDAVLTNGAEIYPHNSTLADLPFWKCPNCSNYVGCHHKSSNPTRPLGIIPNKELRDIRSSIHRLLDPLWTSGKFTRKEVYGKLSDQLGYGYHTAGIRSVDEARDVINLIKIMYSGTDIVMPQIGGIS